MKKHRKLACISHFRCFLVVCSAKKIFDFCCRMVFAAALSKSFRLAPYKGIVSVCFFESRNNAETSLGVRRNNCRGVLLIQMSNTLLAACINLHRYGSFCDSGGKNKLILFGWQKAHHPLGKAAAGNKAGPDTVFFFSPSEITYIHPCRFEVEDCIAVLI